MKNLTLNIKINTRTLYLLYISIFLIYSIYFAVVGYKEDIPMYMSALHFYAFVSYGVCLYIASRRISFPVIYTIVGIYTLISIFLFREVSWIFRGEPFMGGIDSNTYDSYATYAILRGMDVKNFCEYVISHGFGLDDLGMFSIVFYVYSICGNGEWGMNMLLVINALVIVLSTIKLNGLMDLFNISGEVRRIGAVAYGCLPFLSITAAAGLKENFFTFLIISFFYYIYKYKEENQLSHLLVAFVFALLCIFFRISISAMLVVVAVYTMLINVKKRKMWLFLMLGGVGVGFYLLSNVIELISDKSLDAVMNTADHRTGNMEVGGVDMSWPIQVLATVVGPFPNFSRAPSYAFVHSADLVLKMVISYYVLWMICKIVKNYLLIFYPLLLFFLMHLVMVVLSGVAMDIRYQITAFPVVLVFVAYNLKENNSKYLFPLYCCFVLGLIYMYNIR